MKRLLLAFLLLTCSAAWATDITYTDKTTGGSFTAADANEIKTATNSKDDKQPSSLALTTNTSLSEAQVLANKYFTNLGASGAVIATLPVLTYPITRTFLVSAAQVFSIKPPTGETLDTTITPVLDANDKISSPATIHAKAVVTNVPVGAGWVWSVDIVRGTWTDGGE